MSLRFYFSLVIAGSCLLMLVSCAPPPATPAAESGDNVQRYTALLKDPDALVRKRAAVALKRMGAKAKSAVPALEEALTDKDADVRAAVAAALEALDPTPRPSEEKAIIVPPAKPKEPDESVRTPVSPQDSRPGEVGSYLLKPRSPLSMLVRRKDRDGGWQRLKANDRVSVNDQLVSLPGYASEVQLDSGVRLLLRGHVRELSLFPDMNYLQESAIALHKTKDLDADLTLQTGRLYLSNHKKAGAAVVRLRFEKESWVVTLRDPGAEVVVDLLKRYRGDVDYLKGEGPVVTLHLFILKGKAGLAAGNQSYPILTAPPGPAHFVWESRGGLRGPNKQDKVPNFFNVVLPVDPKNQYADKMDQALQALNSRMQPSKDPIIVLEEVLQKVNDPMQHQLAIYCLGGVDDAAELLEVLGDTDPVRAPDRDTAIFTLRRWLGRDATNSAKLFDVKDSKPGPLLSKQKYTSTESERIFVLLHDFSEEEMLTTEIYEKLARDLVSKKVALAELARWHLYRLAMLQGVELPSLKPNKFNAAWPSDVRVAASREVIDKIEKGELPPRAPLAKPKGK